MTDRKLGPEQFRDLFKKPGQQPQSSVRVAGKQGAATARSRPSSNSGKSGGKRSGLPDKSSKSTKKISGKRHKQSGKKHSGNRKPGSSNATPNKSEPLSDNESNRRTAEKSPATAAARTPRTPTTPPVTSAGSRVRTPKDKKKKTPVVTTPAPPKEWNGQIVHEKTQYQATTVFENDNGGGMIRMAEARIKNKELQWKQEESSQPHTDTTKKSAETTGASKEDSKGSKEDSKPSKEDTKASKEEIKAPEAGVSIRDRTVFENDSDTPAPVKEAERVLQYASGAAHESMSEPALRKKKSAERVRGVLSDRPPREPTKPLRGIPSIPSARTPPLRAQVRDSSPVARTPPQAKVAAKSPSASPLRLGVSADATAAAAAFGSVEPSKEKSSSGQEEKERPVSCYLAPHMQSNSEGSKGSAEGAKGATPDSEPYSYY